MALISGWRIFSVRAWLVPAVLLFFPWAVVLTSCAGPTRASQASLLRFPLKASPNGRFLVTQDNAPFLLIGDSPQSLLTNLSEPEMATYFADREAHGFNAAMVMILCDTSVGGNPQGTTFDGIRPFLSGGSPADYDLSAPNPAYFARADRMLSLAARQSTVVLLDPLETIGWLKTLRHNGSAKVFQFGVYLGVRYKDVPNIVWMSGSDFQTWRSSTADNDLVRQVIAGIASVDRNHLHTIELDFLRSYSSEDALLAPYLTVNGVYTYYETYDYVLAAYNHARMPVILIEANYEFEHNFATDGGLWNNLRRQEYWTLLSGGVGHVYGNRYTWTSTWPSFGNLDTQGVKEAQYATAVLQSVPWWNLVPDQHHELVTAGYGNYRGDSTEIRTSTYCATAWVTDGTVALTYCPARTTLTVAMDKMKGPTMARWYDPTDGTYRSVKGSPFANRNSQAFATPGYNARGTFDWVLVLTSQQ